MSPNPNPKVKSAFAEVKESSVADAVKTEAPPQDTEQRTEPVVIKTELDAYITERVKGQPRSLTEVVAIVEPRTSVGRMALPDELEKFSYDCTVGESCKVHLWAFDEDIRRWTYSNRGQFIFRWLTKNKRALDEALDVRGWVIVNRQYFPQLPKYIVSANGIVERGSAILGFMAVEKALKLRHAPAEKSTNRVRSRITNVARPGERPKFLMSGEMKGHQYMPQIKDQGDGEADVPGPGEIQPDRDF